MATTIEQQVALDKDLVPSTQRLRIGRNNFRLPSNIQSKESTLQVVYDVLRRCPFFMAFLVTADHIVNLEIFRDILHICPMIPGQSFDELPFEEEILDFLRDDMIFSTIKVVSRHQNNQQYGVMLPIELTNKEIRNTKAYKEYYAYATGEATPKPKASARRKKSGSDSFTTPPTAIASPRPTIAATPKLTAAAKGKQPAKATKAKSLSALSEVAMTEAEQLNLILKRSRQQMHISQPGGSGTDEGTGFKPGVPNVPTDDSKEEISWNSSDDKDADAQEKDRDDDEGDK
nr:hypothetical protein [Tanacetum cinerariifolium]